MNLPEYERLLLYFHRTVLCHYRASPDLYSLEEDDMGGELKTICDDTEDALQRPYFQVRFGFRRLTDGRVCVAAFGPDIEKLPESEGLIWRGHLIQSPEFTENDPAFERWVNRYLEGSWEVEDGPKCKTERLVRLIRALTRKTLGKALLRFPENPLINYPIAENTDAYAKAHLELYRLLVDGLDAGALINLADHLKAKVSDPTKRLNTLKEVLPPNLHPKVYQPLKKCSEERNRNHGVPQVPARSFPAFDEFHKDLIEIADGLAELNGWLENVLSADSKACLEREGVMSTLFPKFVGPPRPEFKEAELRRTVGKIIQSVEFGEVENHPDVHQSEGIVIHFTDGTSMAIVVGSNAMNLAQDFKGFDPQDVHTDLMVFWAPATKKGV